MGPCLRFKSLLRSLFLTLLADATLPAQIPVTIASAPGNAGFTVAGPGCAPGAYTTPQTLSWTPASTCTVTFTSPQYPAVGTQLVFAGWHDAAASNPRTITAPAQAATYTATLNTLYFLTTVASPAQGGAISGSGFYPPNTSVPVTATPAGGYKFVNWTGATTANGAFATVLITAATTITANFAPSLSPPPNTYVVTQILGSGNTGSGLNNFGQVIARTFVSGNNSAPSRAILWTPTVANGPVGVATDLGSLVVNGTPSVQPTGINDQGQVVGTIAILPGATSQPFLWQPSSQNATTGSILPFLGSPPAASASATGINNYGQIVGSNGGAPFIWTPSSPNGASGTQNNDGRLAAPKGINSFGQVIVNMGDYPSPIPMLFTPATAHGSSGTFATIPGLQSGEIDSVVAINANGTVLMTYGGPCGLGACSLYGRLFNPGSPNAVTGATTEIPIPAGFSSLFPEGINNNGQVVGSLGSTSFLYSGGTVYSLAQLLTQLTGADTLAINDKGQILINASSGVYLATPETLPPSPMSVSPQAGSGLSQSMVFTFSDPAGWQDLGTVNILINDFIFGGNACYLAYSVPSSTLYLVNDSGPAQGSYAGSVTLSSSNTIQNSQCSVGLTSASGNGNLLTLMLSINFKPSFAGNQILFLAAGNAAQTSNSGWVPLGVWQVPGAAPTTTTAVAGMTPASGVGLGPTTYTFNFTDIKGYQDMGVENILINSSLDGRHACYLAYARPSNQLYLVNDNGDGLLQGRVLVTPGSISNSQCTVSWGANPVTAASNNLGLSLNIGFTPGFGPDLVFYLATRDTREGNNTGWQASATWVVQ